MTKLLEKALARVRKLPEERQNELAELMIGLADEPQHLLTDEQVAEVELAMHEVREGKIASAERMAKLWRKFGL